MHADYTELIADLVVLENAIRQAAREAREQSEQANDITELETIQ